MINLGSTGNYKPVYRRIRIQTFVLTWLAYAFFYLCRTNYSIVKGTIARAFNFDSLQLGYIDTTHLAMYAVGQFANGVLGDKIGGRLLVGLGLLATAGLNVLFGAGQSFFVFLVSYGLNGFAQSAGWPGCIKTISQWFSAEERGTVMGFWCTCYQVGSLLSTFLATWLLVHYGWRSAWFVPAIVVGGFALIFLSFPLKSPEEEGLPDIETYCSQQSGRIAVEQLEPVRFESNWDDTLSIVKSRVIWILGATYFFLTFIRYSLLFWLPFYMSHSLHYQVSEAGYTFLVFDLAGILGAILAGVTSDRIFSSRRAPVVVFMMVGLAVVAYFYGTVSTMGRIPNIVAVAIMGFLLYGPVSLTGTAATIDFGSRRAMSAAAGFVNGLGSVGAALSGVSVGYLSKNFGWPVVFNLFGPLALIGALLMASIWNARPKS